MIPIKGLIHLSLLNGKEWGEGQIEGERDKESKQLKSERWIVAASILNLTVVQVFMRA
jgi:hypothetical protein